MNVTITTNGNWTLFSDANLEAGFQCIVNYLKDAVEHLILSVIAYITLCVFLYFGTLHWKCLGKLERPAKRILFITAHPDDECMFFGPTILKHTQQKNCQVFLLCLSKGNANGLGAIRTKELWKACIKLGIRAENICLINYTLLPDSNDVVWRDDIISRIVITQIEKLHIDTVITFDRSGVSKHKNHCSIFYAIAYLCLESKIPKYCTVYSLETVSLLRKYWLLLDIPLSYLLSSYRFILNWTERKQIVEAMYQHKSQIVWYRRLFMIFSRYTIINTLSQLNVADLELDLVVDAD